jgi:CRP/FNR family cyclic AMP-dependent transcriptional regulator
MSTSPASAAHEDLIAALGPGVRALALRGQVRNYKKNAIIINEGDTGDTVFVVLKGSVKAFSNDQNGREITYGTIQAGDYFGEMSLDGGPRSASVMTLEPTTCSVVSRAAVRDHLADEPAFALEIVAQVIRRARLATETARNIALLDVYGRVIATLEGEKGPGRPEAPVLIAPITHQAIASRVGASREMVSRLLKDLEQGEYLRFEPGHIELLRPLPARW